MPNTEVIHLRNGSSSASCRADQVQLKMNSMNARPNFTGTWDYVDDGTLC